MARFSWLWVAAMAVTMVACSGGREEDLSCDDVSQCSDGTQCIDGLCQTTDNAALSATAVSAGATIPVLIIDGTGNTCEAQKCTKLPYGTQVTFRAGSDPGYRFTHWSGTAECKGTNIDLVIPNLQQSANCVANYVKRVKVSAHTSGGEGGVIATSDSPFAVCNGGVCTVDAGAPVKLRADERFGQRFTGWSGAGCGSATTFETTVTAAGDLMCVANFVERIVVSAEAMNAKTDIAVASDGGVCEPNSCVLDKGGNATLTAPVVPKFRFAGWSGSAGCVGSDPVLRFSALQKSESCLATYTPRVTVSGSSSGAEPPPAITALSSDLYAACNGGSCDTDVGGGVTLLAGSTEGFRLTGWSGPKCEAETGAAVTLTEVTEDAQCVANYLQGIAVIGAVVGAPGEVTASSTNPAAVCAEGGCVIDIGADVTLTAPSPAGYRFLGWDGDEGCTSSEVTIAFPSVSSSRTCYARFAARYLVRGTVAPQAGGSVVATSASPGAVCENDNCTLDGAGEVTLTVTSRENYRFSGWSGGGACTGTEPTVRIANVQGNTTCQANFVGRFTVAGIAAPVGGGSVVASSDSGAASCTGATCQVDRGSRVSMTATAAEGFRFVNWSGCPGANGATLTLEGIAQDQACTATFTPLRYTVGSSVAPADSGTV
ncbi:MAG: InlB B-repeat-containing protein, partial [Polyangiales bacterium]